MNNVITDENKYLDNTIGTENEPVENSKKSIDVFVDKAHKIEQRNDFIIQEVKPKSYCVPFSIKEACANNIVLLANYDKENDTVHYNSAKEYLLYIWTLLSLYTELDIPQKDFKEKYDLLYADNLLKDIIDFLPEDKKEFDRIYAMAKTDFEKNFSHVNLNYKKILEAIKMGCVEVLEQLFSEVNKLAEDGYIDELMKQYTIEKTKR